MTVLCYLICFQQNTKQLRLLILLQASIVSFKILFKKVKNKQTPKHYLEKNKFWFENTGMGRSWVGVGHIGVQVWWSNSASRQNLDSRTPCNKRVSSFIQEPSLSQFKQWLKFFWDINYLFWVEWHQLWSTALLMCWCTVTAQWRTIWS